MKKHYLLALFLLLKVSVFSQNFSRYELNTYLDNPWEIIYGNDGFLWITESQGKVSRVSPITGIKDVVYKAADYYNGSPLERSPNCFQPEIGSGTLGLALDPDFPDSAYIYYVYSYNNGSYAAPQTKFKIVRLHWNLATSKVIEAKDLVKNLPTGYDHLGGRLIAIKQQGKNYLYFSIGDNGVSETNNPSCYTNQNTNPNNYTQSPDYKNGKIHRYNIDGSIPVDNPIYGNSFFTRGHRNPQGLIYNPDKDIIYEVEHGDRTDDEINILINGMNYGWKNVRGYHYDNNIEGEEDFINSYEPDPRIKNDSLVEPLYSWCAVAQPASSNDMDWCTVAPSDGVYYNSDAIPGWKNSLLIVTLKNGNYTDNEIYRFQLSDDGKGLAPSDKDHPNPSRYFAEDQDKNGRLRDIAVSPDGKKLYLINNGGTNADKITVYTYGQFPVSESDNDPGLKVFPNPVTNILNVQLDETCKSIEIVNIYGHSVLKPKEVSNKIDISMLGKGIYFLKINDKRSGVFLKD